MNSVNLKKCEAAKNMTSSTSTTLRQYSRITVSVDEVADAQSLSSSNDGLSKFDIIAAVPANSKVLNYLCRQSDIDIISLDFTHRLQFPLNKKMVSSSL